jgi:hypothetical protein
LIVVAVLAFAGIVALAAANLRTLKGIIPLHFIHFLRHLA